MGIFCLLLLPSLTYPLRTPSTCRSTHQMPGMPMIHHRFALRRRVPGGVHWMKANQTKPANSRNGMRRKKTNCAYVSMRGLACGTYVLGKYFKHTRRHGKSNGVLPPTETGKKGAMPEPASDKDKISESCRMRRHGRLQVCGSFS